MESDTHTDEPRESAWQGPMWNGCGACNFIRRTEGRRYCAWCVKLLAKSIATLAANLATAAGLCRAFDLGGDSGRWWSSYFEGFYQGDDDHPPWSPGCGTTP